MANRNLKSQTERLKTASDIRRVATSLGLKGKGRRFFCPNCQAAGSTGHKTPDLSVTNRGFRCFKCGATGDVIELVKLAKGVGFKAAVDWLATEMGVERPKWKTMTSKSGGLSKSRQGRNITSPEALQGKTRTGNQTKDHSAVYVAFLAGCRAVEGKALDYLTGRGVAADVIVRLGLRFCGQEYAGLMDGLENTFGRDELLAVGLMTTGRKGPYSTFWPYYANKVGFLVLPYIQNGKPIYLKAKPPIDKSTAEEKGILRFMNTGGAVPCLYNVDELKTAGEVLICEGETDVMSALSQRYAAVGIPGWQHFKAEWVELFKGKEVFLVLDADQAGERGVVDIARKFSRAGLPVPKKIELPPGQDLNDFFAEGRKGGLTAGD